MKGRELHIPQSPENGSKEGTGPLFLSYVTIIELMVNVNIKRTVVNEGTHLGRIHPELSGSLVGSLRISDISMSSLLFFSVQ